MGHSFRKLLFIAAFAPAAAILPAALSTAQAPAASTPAGEEGSGGIKLKLGKMDLKNAPTYIKSDSLTLNSKARTFSYMGNVDVRHGDMTLTCARIDGTYNDKNQIEQLVARENVFITSGEIRAQSQKATYDRKSETVVLTENPELQQEGSVLSADVITIFLQEERSTAEGQVRVKLVGKAEEGKGDALADIIKK